jgi:hypothetical protein
MRIICICFHGMVTFTAPNAQNCSRKLLKHFLNHRIKGGTGWGLGGACGSTGSGAALTPAAAKVPSRATAPTIPGSPGKW